MHIILFLFHVLSSAELKLRAKFQYDRNKKFKLLNRIRDTDPLNWYWPRAYSAARRLNNLKTSLEKIPQIKVK